MNRQIPKSILYRLAQEKLPFDASILAEEMSAKAVADKIKGEVKEIKKKTELGFETLSTAQRRILIENRIKTALKDLNKLNTINYNNLTQAQKNKFDKLKSEIFEEMESSVENLPSETILNRELSRKVYNAVLTDKQLDNLKKTDFFFETQQSLNLTEDERDKVKLFMSDLPRKQRFDIDSMRKEKKRRDGDDEDDDDSGTSSSGDDSEISSSVDSRLSFANEEPFEAMVGETDYQSSRSTPRVPQPHDTDRGLDRMFLRTAVRISADQSPEDRAATLDHIIQSFPTLTLADLEEEVEHFNASRGHNARYGTIPEEMRSQRVEEAPQPILRVDTDRQPILWDQYRDEGRENTRQRDRILQARLQESLPPRPSRTSYPIETGVSAIVDDRYMLMDDEGNFTRPLVTRPSGQGLGGYMHYRGRMPSDYRQTNYNAPYEDRINMERSLNLSVKWLDSELRKL